MEYSRNVSELAAQVVERLRSAGLYITTVESCTGGALASCLTDIAGASDVLKDAIVTYSDEAKQACGVPENIFASFGVYSPEMARAMAEAGRRSSVKADIAVGITGRLFPDSPASIDIAVCKTSQSLVRHLELEAANRPAQKEQVVEVALDLILKIMETA